MALFESLCTVSYSHSIVTMTLCCIVSETKRDIGRNEDFFIPLAFGAPVRRVRILSCCLVYGKARLVWLPYGEKSSMISLAVSTEYRRVTV